MGYVGGLSNILIQAIFGLILLLLFLRIMLPVCGVRFHNQICQLVYRITNPVITPLSRIIPNWRNVSIATLLLTWIVAMLEIWLIFALFGAQLPWLSAGWLGLGLMVQFFLSTCFWSIVAVALMSFLSPDYANPAVEVLFSLTRPLLKPFRRLPPKLANIDLSPVWACVAIRLIQYSLSYAGLPLVATDALPRLHF